MIGLITSAVQTEITIPNSLKSILENVANLKVAWTYSTADSGQMQVNPLIIDGILYGVTPSVQAFALDAATGKEIWTFGDKLKDWASTSRGVAFWTDGTEKRILHTIGSKLYCLDAKTGKSIPSAETLRHKRLLKIRTPSISAASRKSPPASLSVPVSGN